MFYALAILSLLCTVGSVVLCIVEYFFEFADDLLIFGIIAPIMQAVGGVLAVICVFHAFGLLPFPEQEIETAVEGLIGALRMGMLG